jgi:hypothetical protein
MKYFLALFSFIALLNITATAQEKPVQFAFTQQRISDSVVVLSVKAILNNGFQLFSTKKQHADDPFISTIQLDSNSAKYAATSITVTEVGAKNTIKDNSTNSVLSLYSDSVEFQLPLHFGVKDSTTIKGTFNWLGKKGDEFPNGEEAFSIKIN